jgi:hypothetical protein
MLTRKTTTLANAERRWNDHLLHLSARELQVLEASKQVWVPNRQIKQGPGG